jgi:transcriptional regulator with PAS, ATPase and Fis domain
MLKELGPDKQLPAMDHKVEAILENYTWPGNVRELENVIQHALTFAQGNTITADFLPAKIVTAVEANLKDGGLVNRAEEYKGKSLKAFLRAKEKDYLMNVIAKMGGDKEKAAKALNISMATLYRKLPDIDK